MKLNKLNKNKQNLNDSINLIPMINLIFLLLIFFLLTGVISKKDSLDIKRPLSDSGLEQKISDEETLIVVNKENQIFHNNNYLELVNIGQIVTNEQHKFILDVDKSAKIFTLNEIFTELKKNNITKIFLKVSDQKKTND